MAAHHIFFFLLLTVFAFAPFHFNLIRGLRSTFFFFALANHVEFAISTDCTAVLTLRSPHCARRDVIGAKSRDSREI